MVPAGNALGVLSKKFYIPPLKISGIKNRYNAVNGTFYDAINIFTVFAVDYNIFLNFLAKP